MQCQPERNPNSQKTYISHGFEKRKVIVTMTLQQKYILLI